MSNEATIFTDVSIYLATTLVIGVYVSKRVGSAANFVVSGCRGLFMEVAKGGLRHVTGDYTNRPA